VIPVLSALLSIVSAALVALAGHLGSGLLAGVLGLVVVGTAVGWGVLGDLPDPRGSTISMALTGVVAVVVAALAANRSRPLAAFAALVAGAIIVAFAHELVRGDGRTNLVESVTGTFAGQLVAILAAGWLLLPPTSFGSGGVVVAATSVIAARAVGALPWPANTRGWLALVAGAGAAFLVAHSAEPTRLSSATIMGVAVAMVVAAVDRLLARQHSSRTWVGLFAAALAPLCVAGTAAYAVASLLPA